MSDSGLAPYYLVGNFQTWLSVIYSRFVSLPFLLHTEVRALFRLYLHFTQHYASILPGANPSGQAIENLGMQNGTSYTWLCNLPSGSSIGLTLVDSTGVTGQTAAFTVNPGSACFS